MASLNGIDLGTIRNERQMKVGQLFQQNIPRRDSNKAILLDIFGLSRTITISGVYRGTETEQNTFIQSIEGVMNGQQIGVTFVSSLTTTPNKKVFVDTFEWTKQEAEIPILNYNLTLIEGAGVTI